MYTAKGQLDAGAMLKRLQEQADIARIVGAIGIENDDGIAGRLTKARGQRGALAERRELVQIQGERSKPAHLSLRR